jgi:DNA-3-methyladenine glycosylase II
MKRDFPAVGAKEFPATGPWSFQLTKEILMNSSLATDYHPTESGLRRVLYLSGEPFLVEFSSPDDRGLRVTLLGDPPEGYIREARSLSRRIFSFDHPTARIQRTMSRKPGLRKLCHQFNGLRIIQTPTVLEMATTAIIGQQVNLRFTVKVKEQLIELCGKRMYHAGHRYLGFPTAESICRLDVERLRSIQFSRQKAEYLLNFARAVAAGELDGAVLDSLSDKRVREELAQYRGIGNWTADMILMRALGRLDILPSQDTGLRSAYGAVFRRRRPTSEELVDLTSDWKGFRSYATFYLWAFLSSRRLNPSMPKDGEPRLRLYADDQ